MSVVRMAYGGLLVASTFGATLSAALLLKAPGEGDREGAWFWAALFAVSSLLADLFFWGAF